MLRKLVATPADNALLVLRLVLGIVFLAHGCQHALGWWGGTPLLTTIAGFSKMGLPVAIGWLIVAVEVLGGLGLIVGLLSRIAALGILGQMMGAILMVHLPNGFFNELDRKSER